MEPRYYQILYGDDLKDAQIISVLCEQNLAAIFTEKKAGTDQTGWLKLTKDGATAHVLDSEKILLVIDLTYEYEQNLIMMEQAKKAASEEQKPSLIHPTMGMNAGIRPPGGNRRG